MIDGTYILVDGVRYTGEVVDTCVDGLADGPQREFCYDGSPSNAYQAVRGHAVGTSRECPPNGRLANDPTPRS